MKRARGLCAVCANDLSLTDGGWPRAHYGRSYPDHCPGGTHYVGGRTVRGSAAVGAYQPDETRSETTANSDRETAENPPENDAPHAQRAPENDAPHAQRAPETDAEKAANSIRKSQVDALTEELRRTSAERDRLRAEVMTLSHVTRTLLEVTDLQRQSAEHSRAAASSLDQAFSIIVGLTRDRLPTYPNT